nr:hypothetical protein [Tanacetum cinerariifolium]
IELHGVAIHICTFLEGDQIDSGATYILIEQVGPKEDLCMNAYQPQEVSVWEGAEVVLLQAKETKLEYSSRSPKIFSRILDFIQKGERVDSDLTAQALTTNVIFQTYGIDAFDSDENKEEQEKYIEEIIALEKEKKALENIVYKQGQSMQTMHILTKPQVFYDESHKTALGYQNHLYLTQAQRKVHALYYGHTIVKKHDAVSVIDTEETLILAQESIIKMLEKQNDPIVKEKKVDITPIDYVALKN